MQNAPAVLMGAAAMGSFVASLFFLRFWRQTRDEFFLFFGVAFGIDSLSRFALALAHPTDETEPLYYSARLITFSLIMVAIIRKNWGKQRLR